MYFTTKLYQSIKGTTATLGTVGAVLAICFGATGGGTVYIVGGSLCLANSIFNLIEFGKVNIDIKKQLKTLDLALQNFQNKIITLNSSVESFLAETTHLKKLLENANAQIQYMDEIRKDLVDANKVTKSQLVTFQSENTKLKTTMKDIQEQFQKVQAVYQEQVKENEELHKNNTVYKKQLEQQTEQIKQQEEIILQSKALIQNLAKFGDKYTQFAETINNNLLQTNDDLADTSQVLRDLVEKLRNQTFEKLDSNNDGVVTNVEFNEAIGNL